MKKRLLMTKENKTVSGIMSEFLKTCEVRNYRTGTIDYYKTAFRIFGNFTDLSVFAINLTKELFDDFILWEKGHVKSDYTVLSVAKAMRAFYYWSMERNYIPTFKLKMPKTDTHLKETYSDGELEVLLKKPKTKRFSEYRNWVYINFCIGTGARLQSMNNIKISDLDFENELITLQTTKNRKGQLIPMSKSLRNILLEYLEFRKGNDDDYLFCNIYGEKLKTTTIQQQITNYNHKRGVEKTSIHLFRHTFAKKYLMAGGDVMRLSKLMGHSSIAVTQTYLNLLPQDLRMDYDKFNPLEQMQQKQRKHITMK